MIEERWIALINQELDGANTPDQSRELAEHLARDPEAQALFSEISEMGSLFRGARADEPPAGLHAAVMASVAGARESRRLPPPGVLRLPLRPTPRLAFGAGCLVGACAIAIVLLVLPARHELDGRGIRGTLVPGAVGEGTTAPESVRVVLPDAAGVVTFDATRGGLAVRVTLAPHRDVEIVFERGSEDGSGMTLRVKRDDEVLFEGKVASGLR